MTVAKGEDMKIMFCGGGTAGHITPGVAIAEHIRNTRPTAEILFVGREGGAENSIITKSGFELKTLKIRGFERKINFKNFKTAFLAAASLKTARKIIKDFSPDAVIGTGGYVSWPIIRVAQRLKIPTLIHESNACPGLVTKMLSKRCTRVLLNLSGSEKEFKKQDNIRIVGNPVREKFLTANREAARKKLGISKKELLIASFGGSGGSEKLNEAIINVMKNHSEKNKHLRHIHSCGRKYFSDIKNKYPELTLGKNGCVIKPYIDDMATLISAADIIVSRCGAMTLGEICAVGAAAILIPSPNVTSNHQYKNAKLICDGGAGIMIEESHLCEKSLIAVLCELEAMPGKRKEMADKIKGIYIKNSREMIAEEIFSLF